MKKTLLSFILIFMGVNLSFGQQEGWCGTDEAFRLQLQDNPELEQELLDFVYNRANTEVVGTKALKIIPTVVHVIHDNGEGNISEAQILNALENLNIDYNRLNSDTVNTRNTADAPFSPEAASMEVSFRLAKVDPNGNCTNGIVRVNGPSATHEVDMGSEPHKFNSDGGSDAWPRNMYFNIWVVNSIGVPQGNTITAGYAQFPGNNGASTYGFTVRHDRMGTIGTGAGSNNGLRVVTHEVGHCFGLLHIFQASGGWGGGDGCHSNNCYQNGDGCCDTPPQEEPVYTCAGQSTANSCSDIPTNDTYGFDALDQIENYMSYNPCQNMFSKDQALIMESIFTQYSWAANLISQQNIDYTGVNEADVLCQAEFGADQTTVCQGSQVQFTDMTYNAASGWTWTFDGGTPNMSTDQNPLITYDTPGIYQVSLVATDGSNDDTETKTSYIRVLDDGAAIPLLEGFESYSSLNNIEEWEVVNGQGQGEEFELANNVGLSSAQCVRLMNRGETEGNEDELISNTIDLSGVSTSMTLSFRYAYKRKTASDDDWLRVYGTSDCGANWTVRKTLHGTILSSDVQFSSFTPSSAADWTTVHVTNITNGFWVDDFRYKFAFEAGGGNNFYLDNINIYPGAASDDIVAGLEDIKELGGLSVYPNPSDNELNVEFMVSGATATNLTIQDLSGKIVQSNQIHANEGSNLVMMDTGELSSGMYFLNINIGNAQKTIQFVVK